MKNIFLKVFFILIIGALFLTLTSFNIGPVRIGGWVGDKLDKVSGLAGLPGEMLTSGAINNMHKKLNENIDHLDAALSKNAKTAIGNLDSVLTARENQFDTIMTKNINQFNNGITQNIVKLDQTFQSAISGIHYLGVDVGKMIWDNTKMLAQFAILGITVYFIFLTYNRYKGSQRFTRKMWKELFSKIKFYLFVWVLCIALIVLYRPLLSNFSNPSYEQELQGYRASLRSSIANLNYETAYQSAASIKIATGSMGYAIYGLNKIVLIRQLFYLTKEQQAQELSLSQNFMTLESNYHDFDIVDPEFYIVSALFKKNFNSSKEGLLLAAVDCIRFLTYEKTEKNKDYILNLAPYAKDILNQYFLNPYDRSSLNEILNKKNEKLEETQRKILESGNYNVGNLISTPVVDFKGNVCETIQLDQDAFFIYLTYDKDKAKSEILQRWTKIVNNMNKVPDIKYFANRTAIYNDFIARKLLIDSKDDQLFNDQDKLAGQIEIDTSLKFLETTNLFYFKKKILANLLKNTQEPYARAVKTKWAMQETDYYYNKIDSLVVFDDLLNSSKDKDNAIENLVNCVRLSAELNLYYKDNAIVNGKLRRPLANFYIDFAQSFLGKSREDELVKENLNTLALSKLEKSYYDF